VSSVASAGFPFVVKVEALPPLWRGSVVFVCVCGVCCQSSVRDMLPCTVCFLGRALYFVC
jgi:hypothetical protein